MKHNYCTTFSKYSLYRGLIFYDSLLEYDPNFHLFITCLQPEIKDILENLNLKNTTLLSISDIEAEDPDLKLSKSNRNEAEYAWTAKAPILIYLFKHNLEIDNLLYIDCDTKFFSSPDPIFDEFNDKSILLTRERFYIENNDKWYKLYGNYNGGLLGFKRCKSSFEALVWLRRECIKWCYNRAEKGLYGDQKYLSDWTRRFTNVGVIKNLGINVTAWYSHASVIEKENNVFTINSVPIVFYHYSGFVCFNKNEFDLCFYIHLPQKLIDLLYVPYLKSVKEKIDLIDKFDKTIYTEITKQNTTYFKNRWLHYSE